MLFIAQRGYFDIIQIINKNRDHCTTRRTSKFKESKWCKRRNMCNHLRIENVEHDWKHNCDKRNIGNEIEKSGYKDECSSSGEFLGWKMLK